MTNNNFEAHVENVGCIGEYQSKTAAIKACREMKRNSGLAGPGWMVFSIVDGDIVAEAHCS